MSGHRDFRPPGASWALLLRVIFLVLLAWPASAKVERFAIVLGNNHGAIGEVELRFAQTDARRMFDVLVQHGGFNPANVALIVGADASTARNALLSINRRIRARVAEGTEPMLLVFYSGHADANALHLQGTRWELDELEALVEASPAKVRLLIVDSCRSGALTQKKGGVREAPFQIQIEESLPGSGFVVLTSAAAGEDAHESDEIRGSFFTHHLVSGLRGAADSDGDGNVVVEEAYRYAYDHTIRSSSQALSGVQHPTFRYDLRGQGEVTLTRVAAAASHGLLRLPTDIGWIVFQDSEDGPVVAEVGASDKSRILVVQPGTFFVLGRSRDALLKGSVEVSRGGQTQVDSTTLESTQYAQLVRKGEGESWLAHGPEAAVYIRSPMFNAEYSCSGIRGAYRLDFRWFHLAPMAAACLSGFENGIVRARTVETNLQLEAGYRWDFWRMTVGVGVAPGFAAFVQTFETAGKAPQRLIFAPFVEGSAVAQFNLPFGLYSGLQVGMRGYALYAEESFGASGLSIPVGFSTEIAFPFVLTAALTLGKQF